MMTTRYTPLPGEFFTVTKWTYDNSQWLLTHVFLFCEWKGPRFTAYSLTNSLPYDIDIRDATLAWLSDQEVVRKLGEHEYEKIWEQPDLVDVIDAFCDALATFTAQLNSLSETLKKRGTP